MGRRLFALIGAFGFGSAVACGLSVTATGGGADDADASSTNGVVLDATVPDGASQIADCDGGLTCGSTCTDPKTDPLNCGACGNACAPGQSCSGGTCEILCINDKQKCESSCVDLQTDPAHCGSCTNACQPGQVCSAGTCKTDCDNGLTLCDSTLPGYCANTQTDHDNCGTCGTKCTATESCNGGRCTSFCAPGVTVGDVYGPAAAPTMIGCVGTVNWKDRKSLCAAGTNPCTPQQWNDRRGTTRPSYNYWTDANLRWYGNPYDCAAVTSGGGSCQSNNSNLDQPMRVCTSSQDKAGNHCNWTGCGLDTLQNQYFGGCQGNPTAGTLCCAP